MDTRILSIVTVCYNEQNRLKETIESILCIADSKMEYIIIDGNSTDQSVEIIKSYETLFQEKQSILKWKSESDKGIYDAMNKAIDLAIGQYIIFINIGDKIRTIPYHILQELLQDVCVAVSFPVELPKEKKIFYPRFNNVIKRYNTIHHQGTFYKKNDTLRYDIKYRVFSDFDLNQRLFFEKKIIKTYKEPVVSSHMNDGVSNNSKEAKELFTIIRKNSGVIEVILSRIYFLLKGVYSRIGKS